MLRPWDCDCSSMNSSYSTRLCSTSANSLSSSAIYQQHQQHYIHIIIIIIIFIIITSLAQRYNCSKKQWQMRHNRTVRQHLTNAVVTCEIKIISKLFQPSSTSDWNDFISACGNLPEIIRRLFQKRIVVHEYFPTRSMSLKWFWNNYSGWNNFISVSDVVTVHVCLLYTSPSPRD